MGNFSIPEELVIDILLRLPRKSLARFECVSKQWRCLIWNKIPVTYDPKLLIIARTPNKCFSFHSLDNKTRVKSVSSPIEQCLSRDNTVKALCSCTGLLLMESGRDLLVWNPLTKFFRKLLTYPWSQDEIRERDVLADLCYDYTNDEYKVVLVEKEYLCSCCGPNEYFYVVTCGDDSWKQIDAPNISNPVSGPFFKGFRHWLCKGYKIRWNHVVYFDPNTNEFIEVPTPKGDAYTVLGLGVYDGCLCITRWDDCYKRNNIEFLSMREYGNEDSWEIMLVISNVSYLNTIVPLFKTKEGEVFVGTHYWRDNSPSVKAYDVDGNFLRDILVMSSKGFLDFIYHEECWFPPTVYDLKVNEDMFDDDWSDFDNEEDNSYLDFSNCENTAHEKIRPQEKRMDKKFHYVKNTTTHSVKIQTRRHRRKGNKKNYESKCGYVSFYL